MANKDLVRNTPIAAGRAIHVDDHCRTNVPDVFAAGDCAAVFDPLFAKHRVLDHWDNAVVTGRLTGRNMAGINEAYAETNNSFGLATIHKEHVSIAAGSVIFNYIAKSGQERYVALADDLVLPVNA